MHSCDDHHHVDVPGRVAAARRRAFTHVGVLLALTVAAGVVVLATSHYRTGALLVGAAGWIVAAFAGALAAAMRAGNRDTLVAGAATVALAVTGTAAVEVARFTDDAAISAGLGWAGTAAAFQMLQAISWSRLLQTPGQAGEFARAQAVEGRTPTVTDWLRRLLVWLLPAVLLAVWVLLLGISWWTAPVVLVGAFAQQLAVARSNLNAG